MQDMAFFAMSSMGVDMPLFREKCHFGVNLYRRLAIANYSAESRFQVSPLLYSGAVFWSCIYCDVAGGAWRIVRTLFFGAPNPANQCVFFLELGVYGKSALAHIIDHRAELPPGAVNVLGSSGRRRHQSARNSGRAASAGGAVDVLGLSGRPRRRSARDSGCAASAGSAVNVLGSSRRRWRRWH